MSIPRPLLPSCALAISVALALSTAALADPTIIVDGTVNTQIDLGKSDIRVRSGAVIDTASGDGIQGNAGVFNHVFIERGALVMGDDDGIDLDRGSIFNWGKIVGVGSDGIEIDDFGDVRNWGWIRGSDDGINIGLAGTSRIWNWGGIRGGSESGSAGIDVDEDAGGGDLYVWNWGNIRGGEYAILFEDEGARFFLWNWGKIEHGSEDTIRSDARFTYIVNKGEILHSADDDALDIRQGQVYNFGRIIVLSDEGDEAIDFDNGTLSGLYNWGSIATHSIETGDPAVEVDFDDNDEAPDRFNLVNYYTGRIWARNSAGVQFEESDPGTIATLTNYGYIGGSVAIEIEDNDTETFVHNFGVLRGFGSEDHPRASIYLEDNGGRNRLHYSGLVGGLHGPIRGSEGPGDVLFLNLVGVPVELKRKLARIEGVYGQPISFGFAGSPFRFEGFEQVAIERLVSFQEEARGGLSEFGRALDWATFSAVGEEVEFLQGVAMLVDDPRGFDEALETASGRAQHHYTSDMAFQLTTQRSHGFQGQMDRWRDWRRAGSHGQRVAFAPNPELTHHVARLSGRMYASNTEGRIVVADVIDEPAESPPPRRRVEPSPEAAPAPAPPAPAGEAPLWGAWTQGLGLFADQDHTGSRVNSDYVAAGATFGVDRELGDGLIGGMLLGYFRVEGDVDGYGSESTDDAFSIGPYLSWGNEAGWHASGAAYYTYHQLEQERQITVPTLSVEANSDPDAHQFTTYLSGGYDWRLGSQESSWTFGPYAALQYSLLDIGSYDESGAGPLNLNYDDWAAHSLQTHLGVRLAHDCEFEWGSLVPEVRAIWAHEFMDDNVSINTQFNRTTVIPSFDVNTEVADRDFGLVGTALTATLSRWKNLHFFAGYDARVGQDDFLAHAATAGVWLNF